MLHRIYTVPGVRNALEADPIRRTEQRAIRAAPTDASIVGRDELYLR
jgi:hypothetical protein